MSFFLNGSPLRYYGSLYFSLVLLNFLFPCLLSAQTPSDAVSGNVLDAEGYALTGATVRWEAGSGTTVDIDGKFVLPAVAGENRFTISFLGYHPQSFWLDTLQFPLTIVLHESNNVLGEIEVTARDAGATGSLFNPQNVERIGAAELRKAPCCSLAESFENSPVVDLAYGDPLTGRREIQVLGLGGKYTQLTLEKRPFMEGLASPYALDYLPGPWLNSIQVSKGIGSVASGAQGMTGAINTELMKPTNGPRLFVNAYGGSQGRGELNVVTNQALSESLSLGVLAHGALTRNQRDQDEDRFMDMPDRQTGIGMVRLFRKSNDNWKGQWNILGVNDYRIAGQLDLPELPAGERFTITQENRRLEGWGKTGFFGFRKAHQSLGFIYGGNYHSLNNRYGRKQHRGTQRGGYLSAIYHSRIVNDDHQIALGATLRADDFTEQLDALDVSRTERVAGAYGEYTFQRESQQEGAAYRAFTAVVSLRADHHSLGGLQFSPRLNLKYNSSAKSALRLSAGRGWRSPNILADHLNWLTGSRQVTIAPGQDTDRHPGFIGLETSWNYGLNLTHNFKLFGREGQLIADAFRTVFQQQVVLDAEQDLQTLRLYPLAGTSRANSLLVSLNYELLPLLDLKLAYKHNDVKQQYATNGLREVPLTPRQRVLATLGYAGRRLQVHLNYQWIGAQRLIDLDAIPPSVTVTHPQRAPAFGLMALNLNWQANGRTELYGGIENITGRVQRNAIIGAEAPFSGAYFDASQVYQPLFGRIGYLGVRYTIL